MPWGAIASIINTYQVNKKNEELTRETNQANREMVEMQNKAAAKESEKAYLRSSAPNQVALMTASGMSRAGAINALNGGGSYTPAPVNTAQDTAPQAQTADLSGLSNVSQMLSSFDSDKMLYNMRDKKQLQDIFDAIDRNSDQFGSAPTLKDVYGVLNDRQKKALTNPYVREQVNDFINQSFEQRKNQHTISMFPYETNNAEVQKELNDLDLKVRKAAQAGKISLDEQENIAKMAQARLAAIQANTTAEAFENMDKETLQRYAETRATLEWLSHIGEMSAEKVIDKLRTIVGL